MSKSSFSFSNQLRITSSFTLVSINSTERIRKELGLTSSFKDIFPKEKIYSNDIRNDKNYCLVFPRKKEFLEDLEPLNGKGLKSEGLNHFEES